MIEPEALFDKQYHQTHTAVVPHPPGYCHFKASAQTEGIKRQVAYRARFGNKQNNNRDVPFGKQMLAAAAAPGWPTPPLLKPPPLPQKLLHSFSWEWVFMKRRFVIFKTSCSLKTAHFSEWPYMPGIGSHSWLEEAIKRNGYYLFHWIYFAGPIVLIQC